MASPQDKRLASQEMLDSDQTKNLAQLIHDAVYERFMSYKTTLFLCGAASQAKGSVRKAIDHYLTSGPFWYRYDIFYPEDLFDELLLGPKHQDLVSLENMLAESVDAVVLVIESYGTVAELGAFAANPRLRKKLVVVLDKKHRKDKSFINYGPVRLLRDRKQGQIVFGSFANPMEMIPRVRRAIRLVHQKSPKTPSVRSVVQAHHYVLSAIYLVQPVSRTTLVELVFHASKKKKRDAEALTAGALSILKKNREIELTPEGYVLTQAGMESFRRVGSKGTTRNTADRNTMDRIRVDLLNWRLRGKSLTLNGRSVAKGAPTLDDALLTSTSG